MSLSALLDLLAAYAVTFGWALVGGLAMAAALALCLAVFSRLTPQLDEWKLVREGSVPMAIILAAVIVAVGLVVASVVRP